MQNYPFRNWRKRRRLNWLLSKSSDNLLCQHLGNLNYPRRRDSIYLVSLFYLTGFNFN